jgi:uncharacterized integral membrane protein
MIRFLRLLLGLIAVIVIVSFAVANRIPVDVSFAPLPLKIELPLYGAFLFGLVVGVLVGGIGVWLGGLARRHQARRMRKRVSALESELHLIKLREERAEAERYRARKSLALQAAGD